MSKYNNSHYMHHTICALLPFIKSVAYGHLKNQLDAEDLSQEVLIRFVKNCHKLPQQSSRLIGWICRVTRNAAIDCLRAMQREVDHVDRWASTDSQSESSEQNFRYTAEVIPDPNANIDPCLSLDLSSALSRLPLPQRQALHLLASGYSYEEISAIEKISIGTVRSRLHYARIQTRELLSDYV